MKTVFLKTHFTLSLFLILAVTACTSTNDIQPVEPITPATSVPEENIRLETVIQTEYAGYDEMVERGFDVHINMPGLSLPIALTTTSFSNIYGTREELKAQGYQTSIFFRKHGRHSIYKRDSGKREYHL